VRTILFLLLTISFTASAQNSFPPIGQWREHLPYQGATDVTASERKIYGSTPYSVFSIDRQTGEVQRFSKVSGLSETGVSRIRFDVGTSRLYIAYTNSNIDVMDEKGIHNIPDIKRENIAGDKTVYSIYPDGNKCYLSTGLGIIVLDGAKYEINDSWFIGNSGGNVKVNEFLKHNNFFYAATEEGLKKIAASASTPADFTNWQKLWGTAGLPASPAKGIVAFNGKPVVIQNDSLFVENGNSWNLFFANNWPILSISVSENRLFVLQRQPSGAAQVLILDASGNVTRTMQNSGLISFPKNALSVNNEIWIADLYGGLSRWRGNDFELYKLDSPVDVALGGMTISNNVLYAAAGSVNEAWNYQYNRSGVFRYTGGSWTNINVYYSSKLDSLLDFIAVAVDPSDGTLWAGSFGGGLMHMKGDGSIEVFKQNSPIGATVGDPNSYRVAGLSFDNDGNLWVANFGSMQQLHVRKRDGSWHSFTAPFFINQNAAAAIVIDDANQKWIQSPLGNGLLVFDHNNTLENGADDRWRMYRQGAGMGNLPSNYVMSLARDKSGFIWVGTDNGVAVFQCPQETFIITCEATLPVIKEGGFGNYLFKGQEVRGIAVDGADRKWIATASGAWLVSPDGDKVIAHYNESNSPLLSDDVKSVAINGANGEVFFATAKGISSLRGTATEATESNSGVVVFPNPVTPDYSGTIGIRGLPQNSTFKITEMGGRLVYQGRSLGGQATWNGKDYRGQSVASGVYLVIATDDLREEKVVSRIVVVSK